MTISFGRMSIDPDTYEILYVLIPMLLAFLGLLLLTLRALLKGGKGPRARKAACGLDRFFEVLGRWADRAEEEKSPLVPSRADTPPAPAGDSVPRESVSHDHIPSTALTGEERLEQLDRLLEAGLIDEEEYREGRKRLAGG